MSQPQFIQFELIRSKDRLQYFQQMKLKQQTNESLNKWIEIYSERVQILEKQAKKLEATKPLQ
jgi:predicted outer membrane protein